MSNQKINLVAIAGIQEIDDCAAESVTGGAFVVNTGGEMRYFEGHTGIVSIDEATELGIINTGPGATDPSARGHNFRVTYHQTGLPYADGTDLQSYGSAVSQFDLYKNRGSNFVKIEQAESGKPFSFQHDSSAS